MRKWRRLDTADGPRFVTALDSHEVALLANMAGSVREMLDDRQAGAPSDPLEQLTGIRAGNPAPPPDGDMSRLLPDFIAPAGAEESAANGALRSLHEPAIIDAKIAAVNDMRLALGAILGVGPELPDLPPGHPMAAHLGVYQWLTVLQEYLVLGLMGKPIW